MAGLRMTVVWCPDWPVVSWGVPLDEPAAVIVANRVVATSPAARRSGVALGQRRRDAQGRCPELAVLGRDIDREARLFEPVVAALDDITPGVEVTGPGLVGFPTRGPSRFFGGDLALVHKVHDQIAPIMARRGEVRVAVADGVFAARLAARATGPEPFRVVEPGGSPDFLAPLPVVVLEMSELTDVLLRLGLDTLGSFAQLSVTDVVGRFGREGRLAHRLALGEDDHPPDLRRPAPDLAVTWLFEPPADRIERCAFAAKALADELHDGLASRGLACTRVAVEVETENGEYQMRLWRHQGTLSAAALSDRARWQLDGWLNGTAGRSDSEGGRSGVPSSGVVRLTLVPDEVVPASGRQLGLWGARNDRSEDVTRVVARLQTILGADGVMVPEFRGGLGPAEQLAMVPAAAVDLNDERPAASRRWVSEPWPGRVPPPSPARVHPDPLPVELLDRRGSLIGVNGRGELSSPPVDLVGDVTGEEAWSAGRSRRPADRRSIVHWAGPWPAEQRWWDPLTSRRRARLQVVLEDGSAHLLAVEHQSWSVEATYD